MVPLIWKPNLSELRRSWWPKVGKIPTLKPKEVMAILVRIGFKEIRRRGSHKQFRHIDGRGTTVPFHPGRDISPILLRRICKDIEMTIEEFIQYK